MALNPIVFTERVVRSFLRYQLTAYPFANEHLLMQIRRLLSLDETRRSPLLKGPYISLSRTPDRVRGRPDPASKTLDTAPVFTGVTRGGV
jgi:hypothetical protein